MEYLDVRDTMIFTNGTMLSGKGFLGGKRKRRDEPFQMLLRSVEGSPKVFAISLVFIEKLRRYALADHLLGAAMMFP
jgi:hypothetical protein